MTLEHFSRVENICDREGWVSSSLIGMAKQKEQHIRPCSVKVQQRPFRYGNILRKMGARERSTDHVTLRSEVWSRWISVLLELRQGNYSRACVYSRVAFECEVHILQKVRLFVGHVYRSSLQLLISRGIYHALSLVR